MGSLVANHYMEKVERKTLITFTGSAPSRHSTLRCTENIHTDQYLLFESHHPLEHKLVVIRTLNHWMDRAQSVKVEEEGTEAHQGSF